MTEFIANNLESTPVSYGYNAIDFVYNEKSHIESKKVITTIEQALDLCLDEGLVNKTVFYFSIAFITKSGLAPLLMVLRDLSNAGIKGKILTTDYLTFTEPQALHSIMQLKNIELKMYRANGSAGFHTKGYIFTHKHCHEIIIGSSNLTNSAMNTNIEWNVSVKTSVHSEFSDKVLSSFNKLWFDAKSFFYKDIYTEYEDIYADIKIQEKIVKAKADQDKIQAHYEPNDIQKTFINNLQDSIASGHNKGLLISATGTGKTFACIFAMQKIMPKRILFIVHREFIARQAQQSFELIFKESKTTSLIAGNSEKSFNADFVFATFQSLNSLNNATGNKRYLDAAPDSFDIVIIDECHHIGAKSYKEIADYFSPSIFKLGMSATPDRTDNFDVYSYFDNNILLDISLAQALNSNFLCPFHYFGISDLNTIGNSEQESKKLDLTSFNNFTSDERVTRIIQEAEYFGYELDRINGLVFCSSIDEAQVLSDKFNKKGYKTIALSGASSQEMRDRAVARLCLKGDNEDKLHYIFTVDIFNEGIDIKDVNQILMLRPTQSAIIFVQQLGRGLRLSDKKDHLIVLDFIGNYNTNFLIPVALSSNNSYNKEEMRRFVIQPNALINGRCSVNLDRIAKDRVLKSIDQAKFNTIAFLKQQYAVLKKKLHRAPRHVDFLYYNEIDPKLFIKSRGSLYAFASEYDKEYPIKLNATESQILAYISRYFIKGLTLLDATLLEALYQRQTDIFQYLKDKDCLLDLHTKEHIINYCNNSFDVKQQKEKFNDLELVKVTDGRLTLSDTLATCLLNKDFTAIFKDIVEYVQRSYQEHYSKSYDNSSFVLYKTYTRSEVLHILNWTTHPPATNVGGYLHDKHTNTIPIFVNYHKSSDAVPYADSFIDDKTLLWYSKKNRTLQSSDVKTFLDLKNNKAKIYLFISKHKEDVQKANSGNEFYFLGAVDSISDAKEGSIYSKDNIKEKVVTMHLHLDTAVERNIFDYIVNKE
ncbi:DUF3427 domain-containing protein [Anaerobiospirillum thomasii]|uniref:Type I restriction enzyme EcoKI subunit R n=1 Tax=Anaerobiospirillum thomasii TaxID=179995 RepID=A0A2X0WT99_9GAMM|nr:DUF3427 domain-containing protein [Anaerobiospirillum thomasii]SPT69762.1 type I restriction enzyme EcoKI subunit R [Anaerobiospirillum thomasii]